MTCVKPCPCSSCAASRIDVTDLGPDEVRVLRRIAERLRLGRRLYGRLDIAKDGRDWRKEASEEALDQSVYLAIDLLKEKP